MWLAGGNKKFKDQMQFDATAGAKVSWIIDALITHVCT